MYFTVVWMHSVKSPRYFKSQFSFERVPKIPLKPAVQFGRSREKVAAHKSPSCHQPGTPPPLVHVYPHLCLLFSSVLCQSPYRWPSAQVVGPTHWTMPLVACPIPRKPIGGRQCLLQNQGIYLVQDIRQSNELRVCVDVKQWQEVQTQTNIMK